MAKVRLDLALVEKGLVSSRERAKALIMAGLVRVDGQKIDKAGTAINPQLKIEIIEDNLPFVSRGGLKLKKALETFPIVLKDKIMADIGASTGGFTDCALQHQVAKVFAIDVGYGQLAWKLRTDPRVINMERTNARYLTVDDLGEKVDFISIDVAFISLDKILPTAEQIIKENGDVIALIKPQFEAGKEKVGKKGVVKEPEIHIEVINKVIETSLSLGFFIKGLTSSPIKGPEGNIEYLLWLVKTASSNSIDVKKIVSEAHDNLNDRG